MDYLQEGIGLRAMAQRDPLVEYQREGFDMFAAMMDGIKEESVGFLFNLEVEVNEEGTAAEAEAAAPAAGVGAQPQLDLSLLAAAEEEHEAATSGRPEISAKGLGRSREERPLTYTAPELGSDAPSVHTEGGDKPAGAASATAKRQQARSNPNRGSRGNKGGAANKSKRKR
jgi:preprotein translocase subunit SecA